MKLMSNDIFHRTNRRAGVFVIGSMNTYSYENGSRSSHCLKTRGGNPEHDTLVLVKIDHCLRNVVSFHFRYWQCSVALETSGIYHGKSECLENNSQEVVVCQT